MKNKKPKVGRPNAIETIIKPAIESGKLLKYASDPNLSKKKIAKMLGVSYSTLMDAQAKLPELMDTFQKGKVSAVEALEESAIREATGYFETETKTIKRKTPEGETIIQEESIKKWFRPSAVTQIFLLSNLTHSAGYKGENIYCRDPAMLELKKQELEMKNEQLDKGDW